MFIPSDICFTIMQFLNIKQIISTCSLISKTWLFESLKIKLKLFHCPDVKLRRLFNSLKSSLNNSSRLQNISHLMIEVSDSDGRMVIMELIEYLHQMKSLKMLSLRGDNDRLQIQTEIAKLLKCQELEQLTELKMVWGGDFSTAEAIASCSYLRNLRELDICFKNINPNGISTIASSFYLKNLRIFNFHEKATVNDCKIISENLKELESIDLYRPEIDSLKYISRMRKLKKLEMSSGRICLDDLNVESMSNLESVRFDRTQFERSNVKILGNNFHNLSSIKFSFNYDSNLTDDYISQLFTENIRVLTLKKFRKESLNSLMKLIAQKLKNLKELTIGNVTDEDVKSFVDHVDYQSPLKGLHLVGSEISDKGIEYLSLNSKNLNQIDYISMRYNNECTLLSIDHLALSSFSNVLRAVSYSVADEQIEIEKRINYWKSMNKLINLDQNFPKTSSKKREQQNQQNKE